MMDTLITLDYELFLNDKVGTIDKCLIEPMEQLNKVCLIHDIKVTIFVDAAYIYRLKQLSEKSKDARNEYNKVINHVKSLSQFGHDIELHIHPQWFYSNFDNKIWNLDWEHYKLSDMSFDEVIPRFNECVHLLEEIVDSKVIGFRAGGYSIQNFNLFADLLNSNGIKIDSSVLLRARTARDNKTHNYDYRFVPHKALYRFLTNVVNEDKNGYNWELPISTFRQNLIGYLLDKRKNMRAYQSVNWGDGGDDPLPFYKRITSGVKKLSLFHTISASIDYQSFFHINKVYQHHKHLKSDFFTIIGHPKNFSPDSLSYLNQFLYRLEKDNIRIITLKDLLKNIE